MTDASKAAHQHEKRATEFMERLRLENEERLRALNEERRRQHVEGQPRKTEPEGLLDADMYLEEPLS